MWPTTARKLLEIKRNWTAFDTTTTDLILGEFRRVFQVHFLLLHRLVDRCQGKTAQRVATCEQSYRNRNLDGVHIGDTWQIRSNDCARRL